MLESLGYLQLLEHTLAGESDSLPFPLPGDLVRSQRRLFRRDGRDRFCLLLFY